MAVTKLRRALAFPVVEGVLGRTLRRRRIAIEDGDVAQTAAERKCGAKSGDARSDYQYFFTHTHHNFNRVAAMASSPQPMRKHAPPNGVTNPKARTPVKARR